MLTAPPSHFLHLCLLIFSRNADRANRFGRNPADARHHALAVLVSNVHLGQKRHNRKKYRFPKTKRKIPEEVPSCNLFCQETEVGPSLCSNALESRQAWALVKTKSFFGIISLNMNFLTSWTRPFFLDWAVYHCHLQQWPQFLCRKSFYVEFFCFVLCGKWFNLPSCKSFLALTMGNTSTCFAFSWIISLG